MIVLVVFLERRREQTATCRMFARLSYSMDGRTARNSGQPVCIALADVASLTRFVSLSSE